MAKVIDTKVQSSNVICSNYSVVQVSLIGATVGLLYFALVQVIGLFTTSASIPSDVATILSATFGLGLMVRYRMYLPIIIALSAAASLWGLTYLTNGLAGSEAVIWDVLLYGLAYNTFSWISRYTRVVPVLIVVVAIIALIRITISL